MRQLRKAPGGNTTNRQWYSFAQLADRWDVGRTTVRRWVRENRLKPHAFSAQTIRFSHKEVERFERETAL
jgi:excisionase family DNA binding protein